MPALSIIDVNPITLSTSIDTSNQLRVSFGAIVLKDHNDTIYVRFKPTEDTPAAVRIQILDPNPQCQLAVTHEDDDGNAVAWDRTHTPVRCVHTWSETDREFEVIIAPTTSSDPPPKPKTIYIRVRPEPDLPDP